MSLAKAFGSRFRGDIQFRGNDFVKEDHASLIRVSADQVFGSVKDGPEEFSTALLLREGDLQTECTCPHGQRIENGFVPCKHVWATILLVDRSGLVRGPVRSGSLPRFMVEPVIEEDLTTELWDDDPLRDVVQAPPGLRLGRDTLIIQPHVKPWEAELRRISEPANHGIVPPPAKERQIFYQIDLAASSDRGVLVLQTMQRERRSNGQWGKLKALRIRPSQVDEVEFDDDRRILAALSGGNPERPAWFAQQAEGGSQAAQRYLIPFTLAESLLPSLCATERICFAGDAAAADLPSPVWDAGEPWELCVQVQSDGETPNWLLLGRLQRGEESRSLNEATLLLPGGFVLFPGVFGRLNDFSAFSWVNLLRNRVLIPKDDGEELVDKLLDMPTLPRLELPGELKLEEVRSTPTPHLTLHMPRGSRWQNERIRGSVSFDYEGSRIPGNSPQTALVQRDFGRCLIRDRAAEDQAWADMAAQGFRRMEPGHRGRHDVELPGKLLGTAIRALVARGWQIHADDRPMFQPGSLKFEIKSQVDWFELHARVDFEGRGVAFPELLAALSRGDATVRLSDGSLGILPAEWFDQLGLLAGLGTAEEDHVRFGTSQVSLLDALLLTQQSVDVDARFEEIRAQLQNFNGIRAIPEPKGFAGELRPYQRDGVGWLRFLHDFRLGGCLADDMGLGKTIQLLALLLELRRNGALSRPVLIVVPKSLIFNWHLECTKFTPDLNVVDYTGIHRGGLRKKFLKADIILTTYGTVRRDIVHLKDVKFDYIVLDEAQAIKNSGSQVAKAVRLLQGDRRIALSGTPIENRLSDLWSIFEFLNPGMLGRASVFRSQTADSDDAESRTVLSKALRPFILRRTKSEVAGDLPEKLESTILCSMGKQQEQLYTELRDHYRGTLLGMVQKQGLARSKIHVLEALLRLRQAACHPALLDDNRIEESSAKLDVLLLQLQDALAEGHKALVFSQFTSMLAIVRKHLDHRSIVYEYLDGQTRNRKERIERFQGDNGCGVFLISLKAGGLGLNLTAADYVFLLDPWWNPAVEMQAIDRAHRLGQKRQVFAYRLICRNTVEEKIAELQNRKKELADAILHADNSLIQDLTANDLELLLS
jgi:superfamily II DNA or RNA helicase